MRRALRVAAFSVTAIVAVGAGVVLHLDVPAARRMVRGIANDVLGKTFEGSLVVGDVTRLEVGREVKVEVEDATVTAPDGTQVIAVKGLTATLDAWALLSKGDVVIEDVAI